MRFIILGIGAIGGTLAARISRAGFPVIGIARGAQLAAVQEKGLTVINPEGAETARIDIRPDFRGIEPSDEDIVILAIKSGGTQDALLSLRAAGYDRQPVFCFQNGVESERLAARFFDNVYAVSVHLPAAYQTPGEVVTFGRPLEGIFDIGRFGGGIDATLKRVSHALCNAGFQVNERDDINGSKYRKLLGNIPNIIEALFALPEDRASWRAEALDEALRVLEAGGLPLDETDPYSRGELREVSVEGHDRIGSSTLQGLTRGAGSIETEYLNGEVVLLGRLTGVETPVNARLVRLARAAFNGQITPGTLTDAAARQL